MTVNHLPSGGNTITPRLAEKIKALAEERQWNLLQQLLKGDLLTTLLGLISKMSDDEQSALLDRLQDQPINSVNPEETEIALRGHSRKSCMISTDYRVDGCNFEGFMLDISPTGAFIETSETFSVGQQIQLAFSLPNIPGQLTMTGEILWNGKLGIGLQFKELSRKQMDSIAAFMEER
ncbi:MAG: PilZ domain-containing protein [Desulfobacterales bacterium]